MNCVKDKIYNSISDVVGRLNYKVDSALTNYSTNYLYSLSNNLAYDLWTDLSGIDIAITNNLRSFSNSR